MKKTLIYGYGNPGRQDDGLGAKFIALCEQWLEEEQTDHHITLDCNYQLNIEDAEIISRFDLVIFVDASIVEDVQIFKMERITPDNTIIEFSMHAVSVGFILDLCRKIYNKQPETYILHIKAYSFDFVEELTTQAHSNMMEAFNYLKGYLNQH